MTMNKFWLDSLSLFHNICIFYRNNNLITWDISNSNNIMTMVTSFTEWNQSRTPVVCAKTGSLYTEVKDANKSVIKVNSSINPL